MAGIELLPVAAGGQVTECEAEGRNVSKDAEEETRERKAGIRKEGWKASS